MTIERRREWRPGEHAAIWQARIIALSVFGPYITGNARTEQVVVYGLVLAVLVTGAPRIVRASNLAVAPFGIIWIGICAVMLCATVARPLDLGFYGAQPVSHAFAFMLLPAGMLLVTWYWTLAARPAELITAAGQVMVAGMCGNALIELVQFATGNNTLGGVLPHFWGASTGIVSVAQNASTNGRLTGVFDQPAEAGIAYGVALLCLIYLGRRGLAQKWCAAAAVLIVAGGALTISKVFLVVALPLALITVLRAGARVRILATIAVIGGFAWALGVAGILPSWPAGAAALHAFVHPASFSVQYTAGRYGTSGSLGPVVGDTLKSAPWAGFGAGGLNAPYDSLWVEILVVSGILGAILLAAFLVMACWRWLHLRATLARAEWHLAGGVLALAVIASAGVPSLTVNRGATMILLVIGTLVTARPVLALTHERAQALGRGRGHGDDVAALGGPSWESV